MVYIREFGVDLKGCVLCVRHVFNMYIPVRLGAAESALAGMRPWHRGMPLV